MQLCSYQANKIFSIENTVLLLGYLPVLLSFFLSRQRDLGLPQSLVGKFIVYNTNANTNTNTNSNTNASIQIM